MKTKSVKKRLLQGVVPRGPKRQNGSLTAASKSPFRANSPARLQQQLHKRICEARETRDAYIAERLRDSAMFWRGYVSALETLAYDLKFAEGKRALARNRSA